MTAVIAVIAMNAMIAGGLSASIAFIAMNAVCAVIVITAMLPGGGDRSHRDDRDDRKGG